MRRIIPFLILSVWAMVSASSALKPKPVFHRKSDPVQHFQQMGDWFEAYATDHGLSPHDELHWNPLEVTALYNYYDKNLGGAPSISVSRFPKKKEVWDYWDQWSQSLTNGTWDAKGFFKNTKEAHALAVYNVEVLMTHELGHHLADRYKIRNKILNCHEFDADVFAWEYRRYYAINFSREVDERYDDLLRSINESIPEDERFKVEGNESSVTNCVELDVKYPTDSSLMKQYASAFFVRHLNRNEWSKDPEHNASRYYNHFNIELQKSFKAYYRDLEVVQSGISYENYASDVAFKRGIRAMRGWGDPSFSEDVKPFIGQDGKMYTATLLLAEDAKVPKSGFVEIRSEFGAIEQRWLIVNDSSINGSKIELEDVLSIGDNGEVAVLIKSVYADSVRRSVYITGSSLVMNHYLVDIDAEKLRLADYSDEQEQLLGVACRLNNQDTELQTALFDLRRNSRVLADEIPIPIDPKTVIVFEATLTPSGEVVAGINGYVFWVEPRKLQILAGSGLYGSKNRVEGGFTEVRIIRDVKFHEGEIYLIDQTIPKSSNRPVLQLKKRGF